MSALNKQKILNKLNLHTNTKFYILVSSLSFSMFFGNKEIYFPKYKPQQKES